MSDTKFTPGPWVVTFRRDNTAYISMGGLASGQQHKQFDLMLYRSDGNDEDDAHLISAAPDMFAALELLIRYDQNDDASGVQFMLDYANAIDAARAALAKARGQA